MIQIWCGENQMIKVLSLRKRKQWAAQWNGDHV